MSPIGYCHKGLFTGCGKKFYATTLEGLYPQELQHHIDSKGKIETLPNDHLCRVFENLTDDGKFIEYKTFASGKFENEHLKVRDEREISD